MMQSVRNRLDGEASKRLTVEVFCVEGVLFWASPQNKENSKFAKKALKPTNVERAHLTCTAIECAAPDCSLQSLKRFRQSAVCG